MEQYTSVPQIIEQLRQQLPVLAARYHIQSLGVFGSYVRQQQRADSDFDVLVSFHETPSLLQFIELENELSHQLGIKVDLVMRDALKPVIGRRILSEVISV